MGEKEMRKSMFGIRPSVSFCSASAKNVPNYVYFYFLLLLLSHLADTFIQSDLQIRTTN